MPRPRIHENNAARQRAFKKRRAQERAATRELMARLSSMATEIGSPLNDVLEGLPMAQREALSQLVANSQQGKNLDQKAG